MLDYLTARTCATRFLRCVAHVHPAVGEHTIVRLMPLQRRVRFRLPKRTAGQPVRQQGLNAKVRA